MLSSNLILFLLIASGLAYHIGLARSHSIARKHPDQTMHSRPHHYGTLVLLWAIIPTALACFLWQLCAPALIEWVLRNHLESLSEPVLSGQDWTIVFRRIRQLADNIGFVTDARVWEIAAAERLTHYRAISSGFMWALLSTLTTFGLLMSTCRIAPSLRARNQIERFLLFILLLCSTIAILTTVGIVLSMVGETLRFFHFIKPLDFFLGTTWNPRFSTIGDSGQGAFGILPLLAGTAMIALIALLVAIPLGLMTAIYLSEYASAPVRKMVKPAIEILAGIPTIVYGFFALVSVGPFLSQVGKMMGLTIRATSSLTAGIVMGIMIIPFISSLSDDIITQVPKSLRDGSLGLGATRSETIRKVVLPAALPGIVGAVLLAASRAIGETMIVVLAAGNSPTLTLNPFEAVSTVTVTIVNQLTGDNDFASPQSLVAFALGLTLFVITLLLNVVALIIVRKYREQYE